MPGTGPDRVVRRTNLVPEKRVTFGTDKKGDGLMNPMGRTLAWWCRRSISGAQIRCSAWFGLLHAFESAKCVWPLQGKNRFLPCLLIAGIAIVPDDEFTVACGTLKADPRPGSLVEVKPLLRPPAARAPRKIHRVELQASVERVDQGKVHA
jgi:hypothetical protein